MQKKKADHDSRKIEQPREQTKRAGQEKPQWLLETQTVTVQSRPSTVPQKYLHLYDFNKRKRNMVSPEPSGHTTGKYKYPREETQKKLILNVIL